MKTTLRRICRSAAATVAAITFLEAPSALRAAPLNDAKQSIGDAYVAKSAGNLDAARDGYEKAEKDARAGGNLAVQLFAQNNRAVVLMRQGKNAEAAAVFGEMPLDKADPAQRPLYRFNYGRALEASGRPADALDQFRLAQKEKPSFRPAAVGAFRTMLAASNAADAVTLVDQLIHSGQADVAIEYMRQCLVKWGDGNWGRRFLNDIVRAYSASTPTFEEFKASHLTPLEDVAKARPEVAADIKALCNVFLASDRAELDHKDEKPFAGTMLDRPPLAVLLKKVASDYASRGDHEMALLRYSAAWQIDRANTDAAVYCAALLRDPKNLLDPDGSRRQRFLDQMFEGKLTLYDELKRKPENAEPLYRLHVVLGTIFQDDPDYKPVRGYDNAKFQLSRAASFEEQLVTSKKGFIPSADVHEGLAKELEKGNDPQGAAAQYVKAAEIYLKQANGTGAGTAIERVRKLGPNALSPDQKAKMGKLEASIKDMQKVTRVGDAGTAKAQTKSPADAKVTPQTGVRVAPKSVTREGNNATKAKTRDEETPAKPAAPGTTAAGTAKSGPIGDDDAVKAERVKKLNEAKQPSDAPK